MTAETWRRNHQGKSQALEIIGGGDVAETRRSVSKSLISKRRRRRRHPSIPYGDTAHARTRGRAALRSWRRALA